jgi:hypothetical protein
MKTVKSIAVTLLLILILLTANACVNVAYLRTDKSEPSEISGTYTLLLYGGRYSEDVENVAILDKEGDRYSFEIYAPEYDYVAKKDIPAREALAEAEKHAGSHRSFFRSALRAILDPESNVIGYELRPLYHVQEFGDPDILYIDYALKDDTVIAKIRLKYELEKRDPFLIKHD